MYSIYIEYHKKEVPIPFPKGIQMKKKSINKQININKRNVVSSLDSIKVLGRELTGLGSSKLLLFFRFVGFNHATFHDQVYNEKHKQTNNSS